MDEENQQHLFERQRKNGNRYQEDSTKQLIYEPKEEINQNALVLLLNAVASGMP